MQFFLSDPFFYITLYIGLCLGSFTTALSYRIPRGISIVKKTRSFCPACGHDLGLRDLIPLLSWFASSGKCRYCKAPIGWRYPLIEMTCLVFCFVAYLSYGPTAELFAVFALSPVLVTLADIDLRYKILPDGLNAFVFLLGLLTVIVRDPIHVPRIIADGSQALLGAVLYGGSFFLLRFVFTRLLKREAMGLGDVKFMAAAGIWLGADVMNMAFFFIFAGLGGMALGVFWKKTTGENTFPFGPALIIALSVFVLCPNLVKILSL